MGGYGDIDLTIEAGVVGAGVIEAGAGLTPTPSTPTQFLIPFYINTSSNTFTNMQYGFYSMFQKYL